MATIASRTVVGETQKKSSSLTVEEVNREKTKIPMIVRKISRSPQPLEITFAFVGMLIAMLTMCLFVYSMSILEVIGWFLAGTAIYTFLEYWFHRHLLHNILSRAHNLHHKKPRNLFIILTPLIPIEVIEFVSVFVFIFIFGRKIAYGLNCGICFGQITMDLVHLLLHSTYRPWFLEGARSYHMHHHFIEEDHAHGLTTSFWDMIFGTLPKQWSIYQKYPWLKFLQLPFPLLSFVLVSLFAQQNSKTMSTTIRKNPVKDISFIRLCRVPWLASICVCCMLGISSRFFSIA